MPVRYDKMLNKYRNNPRLHLRDLHAHNRMLTDMILGEEGEWREQLEFIQLRTREAIDEISVVVKKQRAAKIARQQQQQQKNVR